MLVPFLLDEVWHPVGLCVGAEEPLLHVLHPDEPGGHGPVDEGRVGAPAEGVAVLEAVGGDQAPQGPQVPERKATNIN